MDNEKLNEKLHDVDSPTGKDDYFLSLADVRVTKELIKKWSDKLPRSFVTKGEFNSETCTYNDPAPDAQFASYDAVTGDLVYHDTNPNVNDEDKIPAEWIQSADKSIFNTILGWPKTKHEFNVLKKLVEQVDYEIKSDIFKPVGHIEWPKYTKECDIAWRDLIAIEEHRRCVSQAKQVWKDMWENHTDVMRETMPDYVREDTELEGLVIAYVNVGNLSPFKAEAYISRIKDKCKILKNVPLSYGIIWLPTRTDHTHIELLKFNNNSEINEMDARIRKLEEEIKNKAKD